MQKKIKRFVLNSIILTALISSFVFIIFYFFLQQYYLPIFPFVILFFAILTILVHIILLKAAKKKLSNFVNMFMIATVAKLFIHLIFIAVYLLVDKINAKPFVVLYLINYFIFTIYEVWALLLDLKNNDK